MCERCSEVAIRGTDTQPVDHVCFCQRGDNKCEPCAHINSVCFSISIVKTSAKECYIIHTHREAVEPVSVCGYVCVIQLVPGITAHFAPQNVNRVALRDHGRAREGWTGGN